MKFLPRFSPRNTVIAATIAATAAFGGAELAARHDLNKRIAGLDAQSNDQALGPALCKMGGDALVQNFTGADLRLLEGLYRDAAGNIKADNVGKTLSRIQAIDAAVLASLRTGFPVGMLITKMRQESALGHLRTGAVSSAKGNLQSLDDTWIELFHNQVRGDQYYGPTYGMLAGKIERIQPRGEDAYFVVRDAKDKKQILDLRLNDPQLEAYLFAKMLAAKHPLVVIRNKASWSASVRWLGEQFDEMRQRALMALPVPVRLVVDGDFKRQHEIYLAHFLGETGRRKFNDISKFASVFYGMDAYFPEAVKANPGLLQNCGKINGKTVCTGAKSPMRANWAIAGRLHDIQRGLSTTSVAESNLAGLCYRF